ncbi:MAG: hypothetical protein J6P09_02355 [Methanobrevibacter sp.]|nr:hypothetical protein [Methanobrevibacter sp.]
MFSSELFKTDEVTEKLKKFNMGYEDLSEFVFEYKETIENIKELEDYLHDLKKEIRRLGVEELFKKVYENSEFSIYEAEDYD